MRPGHVKASCPRTRLWSCLSFIYDHDRHLKMMGLQLYHFERDVDDDID